MPIFRSLNLEEDRWFDVFVDCMLGGKPAVLGAEFTKEWPSRTQWITKEKRPSLKRLAEKFRSMEIPVIDEEENSDYVDMKLADFAEYFEGTDRSRRLYAKDWHLQRDTGCVPYELPAFLQSDWFNGEKKSFVGDYRFCYAGVEGTWTKFHCDVMNSYSWSANICGRKLWYFVPPGREERFRVSKDDFVADIRQLREAWDEAGVIELVQEEGEIVFVPSSWHHQVHNLKDTISINHNFINSSNIDLVFAALEKRLGEVFAEIKDSRSLFSEEEFAHQIQLIMKADIRIDIPTFAEFLDFIVADRSAKVSGCWICPRHANIFDCKTTFRCQQQFKDHFKKRCTCDSVLSKHICNFCRELLMSYELSCCIEIHRRLGNIRV
ncbi:hypothetical protein L596_017942 [Steinernema carpocapsae]|uniref:Jumonji domain-containing protein 4 n=1 Tax=Steinernema carpocapsae TaxID=34508 RepID=A0A4U5N355_STECR|nr:hypothetical protein L596_017942 [Steinernema carpocapsae]